MLSGKQKFVHSHLVLLVLRSELFEKVDTLTNIIQMAQCLLHSRRNSGFCKPTSAAFDQCPWPGLALLTLLR